MSVEHSAFVIPAGLSLQMTDRGLVIENERDVIIRSKLNEAICQIHSKHGDIIVDIDVELNEVVAENGCIHFTANSTAKKIKAKQVKADSNLEADVIIVLGGDLIAKKDLKATDIDCNGNIDITGNTEVRNIKASGKAFFGGDLECADLKVKEDIKVNGFATTQAIHSENGNVLVEKPIRSKAIHAHNGVVSLSRDASVSLIRGESIRILGGSNDIKAMQAKTAIELAECEIRADVVMAPKINIHPNAEGKIMVAESGHPIGPHSVKGCLQLEDLSGLIEDLDQFLRQRGLIRNESDWNGPSQQEEEPQTDTIEEEKDEKQPDIQEEISSDDVTTNDGVDNIVEVDVADEAESDDVGPNNQEIESKEALAIETIVEEVDAIDMPITKPKNDEVESESESESESDSEEVYSDLEDSEEDSNTTASIQFDAVAELDEAIAELDESELAESELIEDEEIIGGEEEDDAEETEAIENSLPKVSATAATIDLDEQPMDQFDLNEDEEAVDAEEESDTLYNSLFNEIDCIVGSYEQEPDALTDLKDLVEKRNYQNLREEIKSIWSRLLKHHQRNNTRIPPKVTVAFNQINNHLRQ